MPLRDSDSEVSIVYSRDGFESPAGHHVRSKMESVICSWLMDHGVAHRHASEVFTVRYGAAREPRVYVPDIILHDRNSDGKRVIVEIVDTYFAKEGGTRLLAAFRSQMKSDYFTIIIAKKHYLHKVLRSAYDVLLDFKKLDLLERRVPFPKQ
jgi:hypothetical protein